MLGCSVIDVRKFRVYVMCESIESNVVLFVRGLPRVCLESLMVAMPLLEVGVSLCDGTCRS